MKPLPLYYIPGASKLALPIARRHTRGDARDGQLLDVLEEHYTWNFAEGTIHGDYRPFELNHRAMKRELQPLLQAHVVKLVQALKEAIVAAMKRLLDDGLDTTKIALPRGPAQLMQQHIRGLTNCVPCTLFGRKFTVGDEARVETDDSFGQWRTVDLSTYNTLVKEV